MSELILGRDLLEQVCKAVGVEYNLTRRVVLDIPYDDVICVYVEMLGSDKLLNISTTLSGVEKKVVRVDEMKEAKA